MKAQLKLAANIIGFRDLSEVPKTYLPRLLFVLAENYGPYNTEIILENALDEDPTREEVQAITYMIRRIESLKNNEIDDNEIIFPLESEIPFQDKMRIYKESISRERPRGSSNRKI